MKKSLLFVIILALCLSLCGCGGGPYTDGAGGVKIIATGFASFDFARSIGGERVQVTMLIPPGAEAHSFEPTPQDIVRIENSELLICNGGHSEAWLEQIMEGQEREINTLTMLDYVQALESEHKEGMQLRGHHHEHEHDEECPLEHEHDEECPLEHEHDEDCYLDHEHDHDHDHDHDHEHEHSHGHSHRGEFDEHVWTSPVNAVKICNEICRRLIELDPEGRDYYEERLRDYTAELEELDGEFREAVKKGSTNTLIFADRFPVRYFTEEYGLDYYAAFPGCAEDCEPSAKTVAFLIDKVRENHVPAVLHIEFSNEKMADIICEDTGCKKLLFHACHNVTREQLDEGISYLGLMRGNLETLKEALG